MGDVLDKLTKKGGMGKASKATPRRRVPRELVEGAEKAATGTRRRKAVVSGNRKRDSAGRFIRST